PFLDVRRQLPVVGIREHHLHPAVDERDHGARRLRDDLAVLDAVRSTVGVDDQAALRVDRDHGRAARWGRDVRRRDRLTSTVDPSKYVRTARPSSPVSIVSPGPMTSPSAAAATVAPAWRTLTEPPITVTVVDAPTAWPRLGASTPLTPSAIASTKASVSPPTAMRRRDELRTSLPVPT